MAATVVIDPSRHPLIKGCPPSWASEWGEDRQGVFVAFTLDDVTQRLRWIPAGAFRMGSPDDEPGRWDDEGPQHTVYIRHGFWLFDTPCTQALWEAVTGQNPSWFQSPERPVEQVSWNDVQGFLERINARIPGLELVLPAEAQWEHACRAGTDTALYTGPIDIRGENNAPALDPIAWYGGNSGVDFELGEGSDSSSWAEMQYPNAKSGTHPVGKKQPNPWGLYDMIGNVWEWCADGLRTYDADWKTDPVGPLDAGADRVIRGGSWLDVARHCRAAYRDRHRPGYRHGNLGFRCARVAAEPTPTAPVVAEDPDLRQALADLAEAPRRVYYDQAADEAVAEQYYEGLRTNVSGKTLFNRLSERVRSTHERAYRYKPSRHVYPWVDLHPDLKIRSIYSGRGFDPEELIREDFRIDQERTARMRELMLREASLSQERLEMELDRLEAGLPYNCEHVVPQSWYRKQEPMRGDLHHLFACESSCNSFRSNIPYYDFPDFEEAIRDACGKRIGEDKFEPSHGKGAVARATLYFLLRYPSQMGDEGRELQKDRLPVLLEWHNRFAPDEYERHRNMAIFEEQGNRSPLIDHPEWAEKIDFAKGFG